MKTIFLLVFSFTFILSSCSSGKKQMVAKPLSEITDNDFKQPKKVKFNPRRDFYTTGSSDISFGNETISQMEENKLKVLEKDKDPLKKALSYCYRNDQSQSLNSLANLYRSYLENPSYWNHIGACYLHQGKLQKSLLFFNKAREFQKNYAPAINNIGLIYQKEGRDQKALAAYMQAANVNKKSMVPRFNMAQIFMKYGLIRNSVSIMKRIAKKNPKNLEIVNYYAVTLLASGKAKKAVAIWSRFKSTRFEDPGYGLYFATALKKVGNAKKAKEVFERVEISKNESLKKQWEQVKAYVL